MVQPRCVISISQLGALARRGVNDLRPDGCWRVTGELKKEEHSMWLPRARRLPRSPCVPLCPGSCSTTCLPQLPTCICPRCELCSHPGPKPPPASDTTLATTQPLVTAKHVQSFFQHPTHTLTPSHIPIHTGTCCHSLLRHISAHAHVFICMAHTHSYMHIPTQRYTWTQQHTRTHMLPHTNTPLSLMHAHAHTCTIGHVGTVREKSSYS